MSEDTVIFLDTFSTWLRSLGEDIEQLGAVLEDPELPESAREWVTGAVNYLFKSLDLIPDNIDEIGYLDDAFVLRVAADLVMQEEAGDIGVDSMRILSKLMNEADIVRQFLGKDYTRLEGYVKGLRKGAARGRTVADIIVNLDVRKEFLVDARNFARTYEVPYFSKEEKNLVKLKAFFDAKLPR